MSLSVVGPIVQEIVLGKTRLGSAARGATILASLSNLNVTLYTFGSEQDKKRVREIEEQGIRVKWLRLADTDTVLPETIFRYPMVWGDPQIVPLTQPEQLFLERVSSTDAAVVYGSRSGRPTVEADLVVYDPQDGADSKPFTSNGSTASRTYYALNFREAQTLCGFNTHDPKEVVRRLVVERHLKGAVLRLGPLGYLSFDGHDLAWIPASSRRLRYKVGAGGAFSSFLLHDLALGRGLPNAASFASAGAGKFQETGADLFGHTYSADIRDSMESPRSTIPPLSLAHATIRLLAPKFTTAEKWLYEQMRGAWASMGARVVDASDQSFDIGRVDVTVIVVSGREYASALTMMGKELGALVVLLEGPLDSREIPDLSNRNAHVTDSPLDAIVRVAQLAQSLPV